MSVTAEPVRPPSNGRAGSVSFVFDSTGLECYLRELRGSGPVVGGAIRTPPGGPFKSSSAIVLRPPSGVVLIERISVTKGSPGVCFYPALTPRVLFNGGGCCIRTRLGKRVAAQKHGRPAPSAEARSLSKQLAVSDRLLQRLSEPRG